MDLYMAGSTFAGLNEWMQDNGYNKLFSYVGDKSGIKKWETHTQEINNNSTSKLFVDSGAFTAWTKGAEINVDEYIEWLNQRPYITLFGQVDSIPGQINKTPTNEEVAIAAQKTWENYLYMRERVNNVDGLLYTFHVGEPYEYLKQALEWTDENGEHIKYIALGGMVGKPMPVKEHFLDRCFDIIKNSSNPNVKTHAFGMTSLSLLQRYPITSADSTSWIMTAVTGSVFSPYGTICLSKETVYVGKDTEELDKNKGTIFPKTDKTSKNLNQSNFINLPESKQQTIIDYIEKSGFSLEELQTDYKQREIFNIRYLQNWAKDYTYVAPKAHRRSLFEIG